MCLGLRVRCRYFCQNSFELEFSRQIFEKRNPQLSDFMKIRPMEAELFQADRQT